MVTRRGGTGSRDLAVGPERLWDRLGGGREREAAAGHVTGKTPDGRRPSSAPPERPARPRHGVLL